MTEDERKATRRAFAEAVTMSPAALERWLETAESKRVGWKNGDGDGESIGHASGRHIVALKRKAAAELTDEDHAEMKRVVDYVHRHLAQGGPAEGKDSSDWRYSLMNWGHDPCAA